jgi:hypothetical protein
LFELHPWRPHCSAPADLVKTGRPDVQNPTTPDLAGTLAIWVRPDEMGGQSWELLDDIGERVMCGTAADQTAALAAAQFAVCAVQALRRVRRAY